MTTRSNFLKSELEKIYNLLNVSFEYADFARLENDNRFIKIFELLMELCFSGTNQKTERRRPFGTGLVRHCPQGLFSPFFTFLLCHIFPPV